MPLRILAKARYAWLKFAEVMGNVQMIILLSICYWTMLAILAIPVKLLSVPLALKRSGKHGWLSRGPVVDVMEWMKKQG